MNEQQPASVPMTIVLQYPRRRWVILFLFGALFISMVMNMGLLAVVSDYGGATDGPIETFHSGELTSAHKIARIEVGFTIMPPYSDRLIDSIRQAGDDDSVKGALLVVDSPGGLVSDSHQIYHELTKLSGKKPVYVAFKGIAASGGYYIAMGAGPEATIFAEPTTWTGSIGVIIPRYNAAELAGKIGVRSDALKTGPLKDALNPFAELSDEERKVWEVILEDAFDRFLSIIDDGRPKLTKDDIRKLATGQVYTADQALKNGLVDQIGYEDDALEALKGKLGLAKVRVVEYQHPVSFVESLLGVQAPLRNVSFDPVSKLIESGVPRAMYLFGWHHGLSSSSH